MVYNRNDKFTKHEEVALLKAIIVDDEAPARSELRFLLGELNQTEVVAEAASVREAIEKPQGIPLRRYVLGYQHARGYRYSARRGSAAFEVPACRGIRYCL